MPKNKSPNTRLKIIYDFLCQSPESGKRLIKRCLMQKGIAISDKTINNDIARLTERNLIKCIGAGRSIEYVPIDKFKEIDFEKDTLDQDDLFSLEMALVSLKQLKFFSISNDLESMLNKIERELHKEHRHSKEVVSFQNAYLKVNPKIFQTVFDATKFEKVLEVVYKSFSSSIAIEFLFHPYFLKQFNNRWFLIGYREDTGRIDNIGVERIQKVRVNYNKAFDESKYQSPEDYSKNLFGVTKVDGRSQKLDLIFSAQRAPYFISKPIQENFSQKILKNGSVKISFDCIVNKELISELLSYGNDVEVVKPLSLRNEIVRILHEALGKY